MFTKTLHIVAILGLVLSGQASHAQTAPAKVLTCVLPLVEPVAPGTLFAQFTAPITSGLLGGTSYVSVSKWAEGRPNLSYGYSNTFFSGGAVYTCEGVSVQDGTGKIECRGFSGMHSRLNQAADLTIEAAGGVFNVRTNDPEIGLVEMPCSIEVVQP